MDSFDPTLVRLVINLIGAVSAVVAAGLWFRSTTVSMPDRLDAIAVEAAHRTMERLGRGRDLHLGAVPVFAFFVYVGVTGTITGRQTCLRTFLAAPFPGNRHRARRRRSIPRH